MKRLRINPDTFRLEQWDDGLPEPKPIPSIPHAIVEVPELPSWIKTEIPAGYIHVSVFDRAYLMYDRAIRYTKWSVLLIRFTLALITFIQSLTKEKDHVE